MFSKYSVKDFMGKPAPPGYVAGLGRGATGFTTRPDLGPAKDGPILIDNEQEEEFDENEAGLLARRSAAHATGLADPEDDEADRIYASIDAHLQDRRRTRRERSEAQEEQRLKALEPGTAQMFTDLKRELGRVSVEEWEALPEVGDFRAKRLKKTATESAKERYLPLPDSTIATPRGISAIIADEAEDEAADVLKIGEAKGRLLGQALDAGTSSVGVDTRSLELYSSNNTSITTQSITPSMDIGDLKRARLLFASILKTDRKNATAWLSAARLEVSAGNLKQARALLARACDECPREEDVWMEAVQLAAAEETGKVLSRALKACPLGIRLWSLAAARDPANAKKIIRAALERNPGSAQLWMQLVEAEEEEEDAKLLLGRAVECVAEGAEELWLALARLQADHHAARAVLNRALISCPRSLSIWCNAARLEEAAGSDEEVIGSIIKRAIERLAPSDSALLQEACTCEQGGDLKTLKALSQQITWEAASTWIPGHTEEFPETVKALLMTRLLQHPLDDSEWLLIKRLCHQATDELSRAYRAQLKHSPAMVSLWIELSQLLGDASVFEEALLAVNDEKERESLAAARIRTEFKLTGSSPFLSEAINKFPNSSTVLLERVRIARVTGETLPAEVHSCVDEEVLLTAAYAHRGAGAREEFLKAALCRSPSSPRLACLLASVQSAGDARVTLERCRLQCLKEKRVRGVDQLWAGLCLVEGAKGGWFKDSFWLDSKGSKDSKDSKDSKGSKGSKGSKDTSGKETSKDTSDSSDSTTIQALTQASTQTYVQSTQATQTSQTKYKILLSQALKEFPQSGPLWLLAICCEPRPLRRSKCAEALRRMESAADEERALVRLAAALVAEEQAGEQAAKAEFERARLEAEGCADALRLLKGKGFFLDTERPLELKGVAFEKFVHEGGLYYNSDAFRLFCEQSE